MIIALASINQYWEDKVANKIVSFKVIEESQKYNTELIIFPEMTLTGFSMNTDKTAEDIENSESISWFKTQAKSQNLNIIFGVVLKSGMKAKNYLYFIDKNGFVLTDYAKIHPFSYSAENQFFLEGNELKYTMLLNKYMIGCSICYDLRFPELFQALSKHCEVIVNIANWPQKRVDHWRTLLKARAIENQIFMIGVNRTGVDGNNIEYVKSSTIFDANGIELIPFHSSEVLDIYDVAFDEVNMLRDKFPVKKDRKIEFYKGIL